MHDVADPHDREAAFLRRHKDALELAFSEALTECINAQPADPLAFVSQHIAAKASDWNI